MLPRTLLITLFASSLLAAEPEKLIKLRGSYESAMTKAAAPIQKTYTTELEKLKIEFTKAGNLEAAIAVDAELKKLAPAKSSVTASSDSASESADRKHDKLTKFLCDGSWRNLGPSAYGVAFRLDGTCSTLGADGKSLNNGTWKFKDEATIEMDENGSGTVNILIPTKSIDQKLKRLTTLRPDGSHRGDWGKK